MNLEKGVGGYEMMHLWFLLLLEFVLVFGEPDIGESGDRGA